MKFEDAIEKWLKGELIQSRIMIFFGVLMLATTIYCFMSDNAVFSGMLIPTGLATVVTLGYGSFMSFQRSGLVKGIIESYNSDATKGLEAEINRLSGQHKTYSVAKYIWAVLVGVGIGTYFVAGDPYWRGVALGVILMGITVYLVDHFLHERVKEYWQQISN